MCVGMSQISLGEVDLCACLCDDVIRFHVGGKDEGIEDNACKEIRQ